MKSHNYWSKKDEYRAYAKDHTRIMENEYKNEIDLCEKESIIYSPDAVRNEPTSMQIVLEDMDSVSAIFKYATTGRKIAVLNFASYKNPGGKFIEGSSAQEESLCRESFLYNVLRRFDDSYYSWNRLHTNNHLYSNRAIYSPNVLFERYDEKVWCNVITCAAPNIRAGRNYSKVTEEENSKALNERIDLILKIAKEQKIDTLILGAFGCGVFGQDPIEVARTFLFKLQKYKFSKVVFAIPDKESNNYKGFANVFNL